MSEQETKQILVSLEGMRAEVNTHMPYIQNHLQNIDQHLNRLNERTEKTEEDCAMHSEAIKRLYWILGGVLFSSGGLLALAIVLLK